MELRTRHFGSYEHPSPPLWSHTPTVEQTCVHLMSLCLLPALAPPTSPMVLLSFPYSFNLIMSVCAVGLLCLLSLLSGGEGRSPDFEYNQEDNQEDNLTIYYSFYSNASDLELDEFLDSRSESETPSPTFTTATRAGVGARAAASLPLCLVCSVLWCLAGVLLNSASAPGL